MAAEQADTIVGAQVELKGSLHNHGPIHIYGKITGDIVSDGLVVIGEGAIINGPITAKQVDVSGEVTGSITAEIQIELQPKSIMKGDLSTNSLSIKPGALFIGKCQMGNPEEAAIEKKKPHVEIE